MANYNDRGEILCAHVDCSNVATHERRTFGYNEWLCTEHRDLGTTPLDHLDSRPDPVLKGYRFT